MGIGKKIHINRNFSDAGVFNNEEIALFATINAAYEENEKDYNKILNYYKKLYNLPDLQYELFISSVNFGDGCSKIQFSNEHSNLFASGKPEIKIYNNTGLKIGITSLKKHNSITIFVGISGYKWSEIVDLKAVLITEGKGVLQGQVIQAVSIINQFYSQIEKNQQNINIEWIFGGHSLGGNIIQPVAAILSLNKDEFLNQYSVINSPEFKEKEKIVASKVYTFNTLQPKVFLDSEFNFLKQKTINYIIENDWLLKVLQSTGGSYIGDIKLYKKISEGQDEYYFEEIKEIENIPLNDTEKCISKTKVIYIKIRFKDVLNKNNTIREYVFQRFKDLAVTYKYSKYTIKLLFKNINNPNKEHSAFNFIDNNFSEKNEEKE